MVLVQKELRKLKRWQFHPVRQVKRSLHILCVFVLLVYVLALFEQIVYISFEHSLDLGFGLYLCETKRCEVH